MRSGFPDTNDKGPDLRHSEQGHAMVIGKTGTGKPMLLTDLVRKLNESKPRPTDA